VSKWRFRKRAGPKGSPVDESEYTEPMTLDEFFDSLSYIGEGLASRQRADARMVGRRGAAEQAEDAALARETAIGTTKPWPERKAK